MVITIPDEFVMIPYITPYNKVGAVIQQKREFTDGVMYKRDIDTSNEIGSEIEKVFAFFLLALIVVTFSFSFFLYIRKQKRKVRHRKFYDDSEAVHSMQTTNATVTTSERLQSITTSDQSSLTFRTSTNSIMSNIPISNNGSNIDTPNTSINPSSIPTRQSIGFLRIPARVANVREGLSTRRNYQDRNSFPFPHELYWSCQDVFEAKAPPPYKPQDN